MRRTTDDLERMLRVARPAPREEFVRELERSLPARRAARERRRLRVVIAGTGAATALAAVAVAMSVSGLLPLTSGGGSPAEAERQCRTVVVERMERRPYFVRDRSGEPQVRYRLERVPRYIRRCR
jgi:hypothetical protein